MNEAYFYVHSTFKRRCRFAPLLVAATATPAATQTPASQPVERPAYCRIIDGWTPDQKAAYAALPVLIHRSLNELMEYGGVKPELRDMTVDAMRIEHSIPQNQKNEVLEGMFSTDPSLARWITENGSPSTDDMPKMVSYASRVSTYFKGMHKLCDPGIS